MKVLLIILIIVSSTHCDLKLFIKFNQDFSKKYDNIEHFLSKYKIFKENLKYVTRIDKFSPFMDMTDVEFQKSKLGLKLSDLSYQTNNYELEEITRNNIPDSLDYRTLNAVRPVRDQGDCGCCWAVSTMGNIEGQLKLKYNIEYSASIQQLIDCDTDFDLGCNGGFMVDALNYLIKKSNGVDLEKDYPYIEKQSVCKTQQFKPAVKVKDLKFFNNVDEVKLLELLNLYGPLSITVNANVWKYYIDGIYKPTSAVCDPDKANHAVLLIGYGNSKGVDYWNIKNSWGTDWGEDGYMRIQRGTRACGLNKNIVASILE